MRVFLILRSSTCFKLVTSLSQMPLYPTDLAMAQPI
uniref:Uncharacterized protein n=1 Tax=Anguilla anguilla TaxID=7936 RepID=A0A0E9PTJ4_ANGAN